HRANIAEVRFCRERQHKIVVAGMLAFEFAARFDQSRQVTFDLPGPATGQDGDGLARFTQSVLACEFLARERRPYLADERMADELDRHACVRKEFFLKRKDAKR